LVMKLINRLYGINFIISYDSSASIRKSNLGRQVDVFDEYSKVMYTINFKYDEVKRRNKYKTNMTNENVILDEVYDMADQIGYDKSQLPTYLYSSPTSTFEGPLRAFIGLLDGYNTMKVEQYIKEIVDPLLDDFLNSKSIVDPLVEILYRFKGKTNLKSCRRLAINYENSLRFIADNPTIEKTDSVINSYSNLLDKETDDSHYSCWSDFDEV
ncbi:MAG: hypothetical protein ACPLX8_00400, partial [Nanopusillaceae archaeon]